jgi:hypothetical protein
MATLLLMRSASRYGCVCLMPDGDALGSQLNQDTLGHHKKLASAASIRAVTGPMRTFCAFRHWLLACRGGQPLQGCHALLLS